MANGNDVALKMTAGWARQMSLHLLTEATGWSENEVIEMARTLAISDNLVVNGHADVDVNRATANIEVPE